MTGLILALLLLTIALLLIVIFLLLRQKSPSQNLPLPSLDPTPTPPSQPNQDQINLTRTLATIIQSDFQSIILNHTTAAIPLPDQESKARLIGREGRNIKTFESLTGTRLLLDESPDLAIISSQDPKRRQIARLTLQNLLLDSRIHPQRIEEIYNQVLQDLPSHTLQFGQQAAEQTKLQDQLPSPVLQVLGELAFIEIQGQNALQHSIHTARLSTTLAQELNQNPNLASQAGLLHDIGKALPNPTNIPHAILAKPFLETHNIDPQVIQAITTHHKNAEPTTLLDHILIVANQISSQAPGSRSAPLQDSRQANKSLETIALSFPDVTQAFAIHGAKELQVFINPESTRDSDLQTLATQIQQQAKQQLEYPGPIRITVIRESRLETFNP